MPACKCYVNSTRQNIRDEFTAGMSDCLKSLDDEASTPEGDLAREPRFIKLKDVNRIRAVYASEPGATIGTLSATRQASQQTRSAPLPYAISRWP